MADTEADEETKAQQEQEPAKEAESHEPVAVDGVDSSSPEGAPHDEAEAPSEPDGSPAVEVTPLESTTDQASVDDGQAAESSLSEEAISGVPKNLTAPTTALRVGYDLCNECITCPLRG